jgi:hypothetical protein
METNSNPRRPANVTTANRTRISQLLAIADEDLASVEADLYHEFDLSLEEAVRLIEPRHDSRRAKRAVRTDERGSLATVRTRLLA